MSSLDRKFDHHYYKKTTPERVAEFLTANGIEIPGYMRVLQPARTDHHPRGGLMPELVSDGVIVR